MVVSYLEALAAMPPLPVRPVIPSDPRFVLGRNIKWGADDECWPWTGALDTNGYGYTTINGDAGSAHRLVYRWLVGPIPEGLELDHTCHNDTDCQGMPGCLHRRCVNPAHLEPVTHRENVIRSHLTLAGKAVRARAVDNPVHKV
jgi:hypothetical protein